MDGRTLRWGHIGLARYAVAILMVAASFHTALSGLFFVVAEASRVDFSRVGSGGYADMGIIFTRHLGGGAWSHWAMHHGFSTVAFAAGIALFIGRTPRRFRRYWRFS